MTDEEIMDKLSMTGINSYGIHMGNILVLCATVPQNITNNGLFLFYHSVQEQ